MPEIKQQEKNIYQRIANAMVEIEAVGKNQQNQMQKFKFRGIDDLYNSLHPILANNKIFTVPDVLEDREAEKQTKSGGTLVYRVLKIKYTCYTTDGSSISGIVIGEAMDSGDKAANKAMAVAHKYFLTQLFTIPYDNMEDPDKETYTLQPTQQDNKDWFNKIELSQSIQELQVVFEVGKKVIQNSDEMKRFIDAKEAKKQLFLNIKGE
jgi:hypothetical protein